MTSLRYSDRKVLFLNHSGELGGGELSLVDIARSLPGCEVVLLSTGPMETKLREADVSVSVIDAGAVLKVRRTDGVLQIATVVPSLLRLISRLVRKARGARLLYANSQKAFVTGALVRMIVRRPLIWHLRDLLTPEHFSGLMRKLTIALANRYADHIIANSSATADAFHSAGGRVPVTVVHSCIDPAQFDVAPATLPAEALNGGPVLGVFSRLATWKGQHVVIEALASLPDYQLILVGEALFGEEEYASHLRDLAKDLGVDGRVHFLGFRHDSPAIMRAVDVIIHSSTSPEPFGRVIVEGMLAQRPVIATAAGGALEIIQNEVNGLLVSPSDPAALVRAIQKLAKMPNYAQSLADAGRSHALSEFSLTMANARVRAIIDSMS